MLTAYVRNPMVALPVPRGATATRSNLDSTQVRPTYLTARQTRYGASRHCGDLHNVIPESLKWPSWPVPRPVPVWLVAVWVKFCSLYHFFKPWATQRSLRSLPWDRCATAVADDVERMAQSHVADPCARRHGRNRPTQSRVFLASGWTSL